MFGAHRPAHETLAGMKNVGFSPLEFVPLLYQHEPEIRALYL
mgnify:CR=1 FL=1